MVVFMKYGKSNCAAGSSIGNDKTGRTFIAAVMLISLPEHSTTEEKIDITPDFCVVLNKIACFSWFQRLRNIGLDRMASC